MIVYVESNFVLEIALEQEQMVSAEALLTLGEQHALELVLPAFALTEPLSTITHRDRERGKLIGDLPRALRDLRRSPAYQGEATLVANVITGLAGITGREMAKLSTTIERLLTIAKIVDLNKAMFTQALMYQSRYSLSPQDSVMLAAVVRDLQARQPPETKCFITRNSKDFDQPGIRTELGAYNRTLLFSFADGLRYCTP